MAQDTHGRELDHARIWAEARGLRDLGRATAMWLRGEISYHPCNLTPTIDDETIELVPILARANDVGFVTDFSQPGEPFDKTGCAQRAAVEGFCEESLAAELYGVVSGTDLVALVYEPGVPDAGLQIPVTIDVYEEHTWVGGAQSEDSFFPLVEDAPHAADAIRGAWQVTLFDPSWGRNDLLWDRLERVVTAREEVHS